MVFNPPMNDADLIIKHGGPSKVAKLLGFDSRVGTQRVHNWMKRGIPSSIKVKFPHLFMSQVVQVGGSPEVRSACPEKTEEVT